LRLLAEILKKSDKQIILSTYSPYFLDQLEPEDLIIVEKEDGKTKNNRRGKGEKRIKNASGRRDTPRRSVLQWCHMKIGLIGEDRHADAIKNICIRIGISAEIRQ
jgi:hypothetical protein